MANTVVTNEESVAAVHPLHKSYMLLSDRHIDLNNLTAVESAFLSGALLIAVSTGTALSAVAGFMG